MQVTPQIKTLYPTFTKSERTVADFVLNHGDELTKMKLSALAKRLDVGEATIVRFCRKIDLKGYQELKFYLSFEGFEQAGGEGKGERVELKRGIVDNIEMTDAMAEQSTIDAVVDAVHEAESVLLYGAGTSALAATMGEIQLFRSGKRARSATDAHAQMMQSSRSDSATLVMAISVSGETRDLIESVVSAKRNGARIVSITGYAQSTLAQISDYVLVSYGKTIYSNQGTFSMVVSQMYLLDLITSRYVTTHSEDVAPIQEKVYRSMMHKMNL